MATAALHRGPKGHALLGSLREFHRDQLEFYARCAREYGDVVPVRLGPFPSLLICHPDISRAWSAREEGANVRRGIGLLGFLGRPASESCGLCRD